MDHKITKEEWVSELQQFRNKFNASDDDLRSFTLGAIRSLALDEDPIDEIRAVLDALDAVLPELPCDPEWCVVHGTKHH